MTNRGDAYEARLRAASFPKDQFPELRDYHVLRIRRGKNDHCSLQYTCTSVTSGKKEKKIKSDRLPGVIRKQPKPGVDQKRPEFITSPGAG